MINLIKGAYESLLPDGPAHDQEVGGDTDLLLDGIAENETRVQEFLNTLTKIRDPFLTSILSDLEKEYGIISDNALTEEERRQNLAALVYATKGSGSRSYMEARLHEAGFTDLFVYNNDPAVWPGLFIELGYGMYCGEEEAVCGNEDAFCSEYDGGEYVVNGDLYTQIVEEEAVCGNEEIVCGNENAVAGNFVESKELVTYHVPMATDSSELLIDGDMEEASVNTTDWPGEEGGVVATKTTVEPYAGVRSLQISDGRMLDVFRGDNGAGKLDLDLTINGTTVSPTAAYYGADGVPPELGPELVEDGDMESAGTSAWVISNNAVLSKETAFPAQGSQCLRVAYSITINPQVRQLDVTESGQFYLITAKARGDGIAYPRFVPEGHGILWSGSPSEDWQNVCLVYQALGSYIRFDAVTPGPGYCDFDNVSIKKIDPVYGDEQLVENGDFEDWTGDDPDDWTVIGETGTSFVAEDVLGCRIVSDGSNINFYQDVFEIGNRYRVLFECTAASSGSIRLETDSGTIFISNISAVQQYDIEIESDGTQLRFIRNTACDIIINNVSVFRIHPFGGYLPAAIGDTLYTANAGAAIDWNVPAYGNGAENESVRFNRGQYLEVADFDYGNIGNDDFVAVLIWVHDYGSGNERVIGKADTVGWFVNIDGSNQIKFTISDGVASVNNFVSGIQLGSVNMLIVIGDRSGSMSSYLNGTLVDTDSISSIGLVSTGSTALQMGNAASTIATQSGILFFGLWRQSSWLDSHIQTTFVSEYFQKWCGIYPELSLGTANPLSTQLDETYIQKYISGVTTLHHVPDDVAAVGRTIDDNNAEFEAMRFCPERENVLTYSDDMDTGWTKTRTSIYTGELIETPIPGVYAQGIVSNADPATTHYVDISVTMDTGQNCIFFLVKPGDVDYLRAEINTSYSFFDVANGTLDNTSGLSDRGIVDYGDGWYLVWIVDLVIAAAFTVRIYPCGVQNSATYTADGVTPSIWVSKVNCQLGEFPGPFIDTAGSAITRSADALSYQMDDGNSNDTFGTIRFDLLVPYGAPTADSDLILFWNGVDAGNSMAFLIDSNGKFVIELRVRGSVAYRGVSNATVADNETHEIHLMYDDGPFSLYIDRVFDFSDSEPLTTYNEALMSAEESTFWLQDFRIFEQPKLPGSIAAVTRTQTLGQRYYMVAWGRSTTQEAAPTIKDGGVELWSGTNTDDAWDYVEHEWVAQNADLKLTMDQELGIVGFDNVAIFERTLRGNWNLVFFVGGAVTRDSGGRITHIERVPVSSELRENLRRIIIRHKPLQTWGALVVEYT